MFDSGQLALDATGGLWIGTVLGVYRIAPETVRKSDTVPRALIVGATTAGQLHGVTEALSLRAGTHDIQLDYTAPIPDTPERARFRYQLAGYDTAWQETGARRQAFYTGLGAGHYAFNVQAAQASSGWSDTASLSIDIAPAWFQTWWWRVLCLVAVVSSLVLLHRLRVRRITQRLREQNDTRLHKRERIARDFHDTVLQTNFALLLQMRAVAATASGDTIRHRLDTIVNVAQATLNEGRDKVAGLRAPQIVLEPSLTLALRRLVDSVLKECGSAGIVASQGAPWKVGCISQPCWTCTRKVVGWAMAPNMPAQLVCDALNMAIQQRRLARINRAFGTGSQYAKELYQDHLTRNGFVCSMSRKGNCRDNAVAE